MGNAANNTQILMGRLAKLVVVLVLVYVVYGIVINRDYIRYRGQKKYQVERYGHVWNTNLRSAKQQADSHNRKVLIAFIHSGGGNAASDNLIKRIFPSADFRHAINTYIPMLCDIQEGVTPPGGLKANQEEVIKQYDLQLERAGVLLLIDSEGKELARLAYSNETPAALNSKLGGGKFIALQPVGIPRFRIPLADFAAKTADKAREAVSDGVINPPEEELSEEEKAAAEAAAAEPGDKETGAGSDQPSATEKAGAEKDATGV